MFYNECWACRCDTMHYEEEQKKRLSQCHMNLFDKMMNGECDVRTHAERTKLDVDLVQNETIRAQTLGALKMKRKLKKHPHSEIRRFLMGEGN